MRYRDGASGCGKSPSRLGLVRTRVARASGTGGQLFGSLQGSPESVLRQLQLTRIILFSDSCSSPESTSALWDDSFSDDTSKFEAEHGPGGRSRNPDLRRGGAWSGGRSRNPDFSTTSLGVAGGRGAASPVFGFSFIKPLFIYIGHRNGKGSDVNALGACLCVSEHDLPVPARELVGLTGTGTVPV